MVGLFRQRDSGRLERGGVASLLLMVTLSLPFFRSTRRKKKSSTRRAKMTLASMKSLYSQLIRYERESPPTFQEGAFVLIGKCGRRHPCLIQVRRKMRDWSRGALLMSSVALIRGLISLYVSVDLLTVDMDTIPRTWVGCSSW